jgi:hypothetical protein
MPFLMSAADDWLCAAVQRGELLKVPGGNIRHMDDLGARTFARAKALARTFPTLCHFAAVTQQRLAQLSDADRLIVLEAELCEAQEDIAKLRAEKPREVLRCVAP